MSGRSIAIVASHPIQYNSNWFRAMSADSRLKPHVYYCHQPSAEEQGAAGFGVNFEWDIPLLEGYDYTFLRNAAKVPSLHRFRGLQIPEFSNIVRQHPPDAILVLGWLWQSDWQAMFAAWRHKVPLLIRGDSTLQTARSRTKRAAKELGYRAFLGRAQACLAVGSRSRAYFEHYGVASNRIFLVPHSIDVERFSQLSDDANRNRAALRARWGVGESQACFLFSGKFLPRKRPLDFVQAIAQARSKQERVIGLMVGDGPMRSEIEAEISRTQAPIRLTGFLNQSEIVDAYIASDVLVLPSDARETWGLVVNEAMACSRPAILSNSVGCAPDLILARKTGDTYDEGDVASLSTLIAQYSDGSRDLSEMGSTARSRLREFSVDVAVNGVVQAVDSVTPHR